MKSGKLVKITMLAILSVSSAANAAGLPRLECLLEPNQTIKISSPVAGVLETVRVQRGSYVKKGQVLATLKSGVEQAQVDLARAKADFSKRKSVRNNDLFKKQLISHHEKDEMETEALVARQELRLAREKLELRTIRSPISGIVVERHNDPGEHVTTEPMLTVVSINPLHVEVIIPVEHFGKIRTGMTALVSPSPPLKGSYQARVVIVDRIIDAASGTFRVRLRLPNPGNKIPAGVKCVIEFKSKTTKKPGKNKG